MSLLPADELKKIEDKVERKEMVVDFYDILGEVQKNKPAAWIIIMNHLLKVSNL